MESLQQSYLGARWSFGIQPTAGQVFNASNLLYVNTPPWMARAWTLNLQSMRYTGGTLAVGNQPPDNQVDTNPAYQAVITWGVDGALETAFVDYPWGGATICVQAAVVQVGLQSVNQVASAIPPMLQGFIAPAVSVPTAIVNPTLTTGLLTVGALGSQVYACPRRACAYRPFIGGSTIPPTALIELRQITNSGGGPTIMNDGNWPPPNQMSQQERCGYYPLHPQCERVQVTNTSAGVQTVGLQFLLDMG